MQTEKSSQSSISYTKHDSKYEQIEKSVMYFFHPFCFYMSKFFMSKFFVEMYFFLDFDHCDFTVSIDALNLYSDSLEKFEMISQRKIIPLT